MKNERLTKGRIFKLDLKIKNIFKGIALTTALFTFSQVSLAALAPADIEPPTSLKGKPVPEPSNLNEFVKNKQAAIALGKALFWEARISSDGQKACATCHFSAGADNRIRNQLAPAAARALFHTYKPNTLLTANDFPLTRFSDLLKNDSDASPIRDVRDVVGSQGVFFEKFLSLTPGADRSVTESLVDPLFRVGNLNVNRVTGRNSPTNINAVFNLRNFWDGRAQTIFNGSSPFGLRDPNAGIYKNILGTPQKVKVVINDASLASQATGPLLSDIEMSATGRIIPDIGKRVLPMRALANQKVALDDSVLGPYADLNGNGLKVTYQDAIKQTFVDSLWNANKSVTINGKQYSQMEANFSLFFGLAVQLYEATLISDETPFDKYAEGNTSAMSAAAQRGFGLFVGKGDCVACHDGALFSGAAITRKNVLGQTDRIQRMLMGNNQQAVYDNGFYNIGVSRTEDDLGVGGKDPFGNPLSFSLLAKNLIDFANKEKDVPNVTPSLLERVAVNGAFKAPGLRNVALTAPYFHNGSYLTLRSVVEFYNHGGNFPRNNKENLDADIKKLGLTDQEMDDLVTFMESLTDPRVQKHAAPFDHPSLVVVDGFVGDQNATSQNPSLPGRAQGISMTIPAVGRFGYASNSVPTFSDRLGVNHHTRGVEYVPSNAIKCANENATCALPSGVTTTVWYGAGERWYKKAGVSGNIGCNNGVFGDPNVGVGKECRYEPATAAVQPPANAIKCANENATCALPAGVTTTVWYGTGSTWFKKTGMSGNIGCNNGVFGDPNVGVGKECRYEPATVVTPPNPTWAKCANVFGVCNVSGTKEVRYRTLLLTSNPRTVTSSISCSPTLFGMSLLSILGGYCEVKQ